MFSCSLVLYGHKVISCVIMHNVDMAVNDRPQSRPLVGEFHQVIQGAPEQFDLGLEQCDLLLE